MTGLEELKAFSKNALSVKERTLSALAEKQKLFFSEKEFHDAILDVVAELPTIYKVTVAQIRDAQSLEEVTALWREAHEAYESIRNSWRDLTMLVGSHEKDELFVYCTKRIEQLVRNTEEAYAFHA